MSVPSNLLQTVTTYQKAELAALQNYACLLSTFDKKFKDFQNFSGNLGASVTFDTPPRSYAVNSLNASFGASQQYTQTLTVDQPLSVSRAITAEQLIYNDMKDYMMAFGRADVMELGANIEKVLALNAISAVPVRDTTGAPTGAFHTDSGPYICYGDGRTAINSYQQIAQFVENFKDMGFAGQLKMYLPTTYVPPIIGSGLTQFAPVRNNQDASTWWIGDFDGVSFYRSNLLPTQFAGNVGIDNDTLTVVSTNDATGANITQITFSGATHSGGNDANAIKSGDIITFASSSNARFLTEYGHSTTAQLVQVRARSDAASVAGTVVVDIAYLSSNSIGLVAVVNQNQNINRNIIAGMTATVANSHRAGLLLDEQAAFLAMPQMPSTAPYAGANKTDEKTGATLRSYYGMIPFQNQYGYTHDCVFGSTIVPRRSARIAFPL